MTRRRRCRCAGGWRRRDLARLRGSGRRQLRRLLELAARRSAHPEIAAAGAWVRAERLNFHRVLDPRLGVLASLGGEWLNASQFLRWPLAQQAPFRRFLHERQTDAARERAAARSHRRT